MNTSRREARRAEIDRDHRLVALGFLKNLQRLVDDQVARVLLDDAVWPDQVFEAVQAVLADGAAEHRYLNDHRINLRGHRGATFEDTAPLPEVLAAYRHRGNYHGAFATMGDAGRVLLLELALPEGWVDRGLGVMLAELLHRRGELWTFERNGAVHVFGRPGSPADQALALRARRWGVHGGADEPDTCADGPPRLRLVGAARELSPLMLADYYAWRTRLFRVQAGRVFELKREGGVRFERVAALPGGAVALTEPEAEQLGPEVHEAARRIASA